MFRMRYKSGQVRCRFTNGSGRTRSTPMRVLLLLSAFLTAVVGLGTPAAASQHPAYQVAATASAGAERQAPVIAAGLPAGHHALNHIDLRPVILPPAPARAVPIYAERLRV